MLHPAIELRFINHEVGYGVFAAEDIPAGTITWALDPLDQVIPPSRTQELGHLLHGPLERYSWFTATGDRILCWDHGRFMNHSCEPNSAGPGLMEFEVALRDIRAGEEVVCDYGTFNLEEDMVCLCGAPGCRGVVSRSDFPRIAAPLDARVRRALPRLPHVDQPLWPVVERWHDVLARAAARPVLLPSLLENWLRPVEDELLPARAAGL